MNPAPRIEHINLAVGNAEASAVLLADLFGWHERWRGAAADGGFTIHVGTADDYVAIYQAPGGDGWPLAHEKQRPLNHVGIVVPDLAATEQRAIALGLTPFNHGDYAPGRRFYLFDRDAIEWEIVSYA